MTNPSKTSRLPVATSSAKSPSQELAPQSPEARQFDAHGFDPDDYDWMPVPRTRGRHDGWSPDKQRSFIGALADSGSVTQAAREAGMSPKGAYRLRRSPGGEGFARAWELAIQAAGRRLADIAFERAVDGVEEPVLDRGGNCIYVKRKFNDRLLMFLLRAHHPQLYGFAPERGDAKGGDDTARGSGGDSAESKPILAQAIAALGPAIPDDPLAAMDTDDRANLLANLEEDAKWEESERDDGDLESAEKGAS